MSTNLLHTVQELVIFEKVAQSMCVKLKYPTKTLLQVNRLQIVKTKIYPYNSWDNCLTRSI